MRTHYCGQVDETLADQEVEIYGWVHHRRDHGGVIFTDLRDREGVVQVVYQPDNKEVFANAEKLRNEYVLQVKGIVKIRPEGMLNPGMRTGKIEVIAKHLTILNHAEPLPFLPGEHQKTGEEVRLRYRYIDLRRSEMYQRIALRSQMNRVLRDFLDNQGFLDVETPILTKATPEGARDYLVPSRTQQGAFFALPQSPQLFKQLLMMSGIDRYYQIARCFRDEDLRADRQPEFTQLDIEASFMDEESIQSLMEQMICHLFKSVLKVDLPQPFPKMSYSEAMQRFGSDKPDLRIPLELVDIAEFLTDVEFKVFSGPANDPQGRVVVLRVPGGASLSRKDIDGLTKFVSIYGAKGLAYIKINDIDTGIAGLQSPILKFIPEAQVKKILDKAGAVNGDILFFGADRVNVVNEAMGALRVKVGHQLELVKPGWQPLWVIDWPMFERSSDKSDWQALHHPFTAPNVDDPQALLDNPGNTLSRAYDMVLNGSEIGGGSIRIHQPAMQQAVFKLLGISDEQANEKFGFLLEALTFGCPPHGGIAFGLDRLAMLMSDTQSIRDVIAFPKTQSAACLLTDAPSDVDPLQLKELGIKIQKKITEIK